MKKTSTVFSIGALFLFAALILSSCRPDAKAESGPDVYIEMEVNRVSAGFVETTYTPDCPCYYLTSVDKVIPGVDPDEYAQTFMDLALDSCYVRYVEWRHDHLMSLEKDIADFPSHYLNYGKTTIIQNYLKPDTDYWVYCFVVDKDSNKANGRLFWTTIHTEKESIFKTIRFSYRIRGEWDYVYPYDTQTGELVTNVPWVGQTADSLAIRQSGYTNPGAYFDAAFKKYDNDHNTTFMGVYAHQNNGVGDGTSSTRFEKGHTYYTAMATLDGPRNECFDIYRFRWEGPDTEMLIDDDQSTKGAW